MKKAILFISTIILALAFNSALAQNSIQAKQLGAKGQPILFLPHVGCSSDMWKEIADHYSTTNKCYLINFAGFAGMPAIQQPYSQQYVQGLVQFIKENKLEDCILVGQNYGAYVASKVAAEMPDNIKVVVAADFYPKLSMVLDKNMTPEKLAAITKSLQANLLAQDSAAFIAYQKQMAQGMNYIDTTKVVDFLRWQVASDRATIGGTLAEQLSDDVIPYFQKNTVPTLVFTTWYFAKTYNKMPLSESKNVLDGMYPDAKNVTHVITEDAKDFIAADQPQWFIEKLDEFLNRTATMLHLPRT